MTITIIQDCDRDHDHYHDYDDCKYDVISICNIGLCLIEILNEQRLQSNTSESAGSTDQRNEPRKVRGNEKAFLHFIQTMGVFSIQALTSRLVPLIHQTFLTNRSD